MSCPDIRNGQCEVSEWNDIIAISAGDYHTVGLKSDGTVVAVGNQNSLRPYKNEREVSEWQDIVQICAGKQQTFALKSDGTIIVAGGYTKPDFCSSWNDIIKIRLCNSNTLIGFKSDGTVLGYNIKTKKAISELSSFKDIKLPNY